MENQPYNLLGTHGIARQWSADWSFLNEVKRLLSRKGQHLVPATNRKGGMND